MIAKLERVSTAQQNKDQAQNPTTIKKVGLSIITVALSSKTMRTLMRSGFSLFALTDINQHWVHIPFLFQKI